jgi:hypothetical protein
MSGSPITTSKHLFVFNEDGLGQFIRLGEKEGEEVATVQLEETILCTPAVAKGSLYVRSDKSLWKLSD